MHVETRTARNSAETLKLQLHRMDIYSYNDFVTYAGFLHGVCVGACCFVSPLCGFSLSLFCNYFVTYVHQGQVLNPVHSLLMGAQTLDTQVAVAL